MAKTGTCILKVILSLYCFFMITFRDFVQNGYMSKPLFFFLNKSLDELSIINMWSNLISVFGILEDIIFFATKKINIVSRDKFKTVFESCSFIIIINIILI